MTSGAYVKTQQQRESAESSYRFSDDTWRKLAATIQAGKFTPVIGPLLAGDILGSREDIARRWVLDSALPLLPHWQGDLAQVAQYMRVARQLDDKAVRDELQKQVMDYIREQREQRKPNDRAWDLPNALVAGLDPSRAILEVGKRLREVDKDDPYHILAELKTDVYITTGWTDLLQKALIEKNRDPITRAFSWKGPGKKTTPVLPTVERPLVYHLYGRFDNLDSLVISEDDYFTWLNEWAIRRESVPPSALLALTAKSLLFLGYRLDDWDFRVVFQTIRNLGGRTLLMENQHVAAQFTTESHLFKQEAVERYLESYFGRAHVSIYWGQTRQFLNELRDRILS